MLKKIIRFVINSIIILVSVYLLLSVFTTHFFNEKETTVPNLVKLEKDQAIATLKKNGLKYLIINGKANSFEENSVFSQYPKAYSKVKVNRVVQIWVNNSENVSLPNLVGKSLTDARIYLNDLNINISRIDYLPDNNFTEETVLATYPNSDSRVSRDNKIALLVSSKSLIKENTMPNLIGLELDEANNILKNINRKVEVISEANDPSFAKNVIIATNPIPNQNLSNDDKISVVLNTGLELDKSINDIIKDEKKLTDKEIEEILEKELKKNGESNDKR